MKLRYPLILMFIAGIVLAAGAGFAQTDYAMLDIIGYLYESDTPASGTVPPEDVDMFPPSNAGDVLAGLGFIDNVSDPLIWGVDFSVYQYTWVLGGLVSGGQVVLGDGTLRIFYSGGTIDIMADPLLDIGYTTPYYGTNPPDAGAISSFGDGYLYLHGVFSNFVMDFDPISEAGSFQGFIDFTLGTHFAPGNEQLENGDGYTLSGVLGPGADGTIPEGYDLETDGHIWFDPTVPDEDMTWGGVKNLYN